MSETEKPQPQEVFGCPGYRIQFPVSGGMILTRRDGTTVCGFESAMPEGAVRRIAAMDNNVQHTWREMQMALMTDLVQYIALKVRLDEKLVHLRNLVHGGALAEEFSPGRRGRGA